MEDPKWDPEEAKKAADGGDVLFVDVRNPHVWTEATEKLPGSVRVPVDKLEEHLGELPKDKTLVTYCT